MKHFLVPIALMACLLAASCNTNKKLYEAKEYDKVILRNVPKICSGRISHSTLDYVAASYHQANQADHERIQALKASGNPEIWPEVFERYSSMKGRGEALRCLSNKSKKQLGIVPLHLNEELSLARNKAEAYLTAKISQILNEELPDLDEADHLIRDLERINCDNALINDLKLKSLAKRYGDLNALMHLEVFQQSVTPNRDEAVSFKETQNGLTATVTDHNLSKKATLSGNVNFIDPKSKRMLLSYPYEISSNFSYSYTTVEGPQGACSEQTLERLKQQPVPFPTDESLINDAIRQLMDLIYQKIQ